MNNQRVVLSAIFFIWISAGLQQGLGVRMSIFSAQPDFLLVTACLFGLMSNTRIALILGLVIGFAQSAIVGSDMWQFILTRMAAAWICAFLVENRFQRNAGVGALATLVCTIISGILLMILTAQPNIGGVLKATLMSAMYNAVLAIVAYYPIERAAGVKGQQL